MTIDSAKYYYRKFEIWKAAKDFPKIAGGCNYTFTFTLGRDDFGFEYGSYKRVYNGPAIDLTDATVKLHIEKFAHKPSLIEEARGVDWTQGSTLCTITGVVTDASNGVCTFTLSTTESDGSGDYIGEIEITDSSSNKIVPGYVRFHFFEKLLLLRSAAVHFVIYGN